MEMTCCSADNAKDVFQECFHGLISWSSILLLLHHGHYCYSIISDMT